MRTKTISQGNKTAVIRPKTRLSSVRTAQYKKALVKQIPELANLETPTSEAQLVLSTLEKNVEWATLSLAEKFAALADHIIKLDIQNDDKAFWANDGQFTDTALYAAYVDYSNSDADDPNDFWSQVEKAIVDFAEPLTPAFQQPPEVAGGLDPEAVSAAQVG